MLTHTLVCYLLGAQSVTATDITPLAQPRYLRDALNVSDASLVREVLSPYSQYERIRERLLRIQHIDRFSFSALEELGITYLAPVDIGRNPLPGTCDFIYSFDVLEHIPRRDVVVFLTNLSRSLSPGGCMVHAIHTEDHRDSREDPFSFLTIPQDSYPDTAQALRGNRMRGNEWKSVFDQIPGMKFTILYAWFRQDQEIPAGIDPSITVSDGNDLRIAYLGVMGRRQ
jgi:SAM-dependent methyltransferase